MGAGAIGCYVGGRLATGARTDVDVVLVGRTSIADEINAHGLRLTRYDGRDASLRAVPHLDAVDAVDGVAALDTVVAGASRLMVTTDVNALARCDVVVVTVKGGDSASAGASMASVLREDCVVVSLQNGVRNAGLLDAALPKQRVVAAMVPFNVLRAGDGRFHQGTSGRIALGHAADAEARSVVDELARAWNDGGMSARVVDDIEAIQWGKLLINLNNAVNALAGVPIQTMIKDRGYRLVMAAVLDEAVGVLAAAKVKTILEPPVPARIVARLLRSRDAIFGFIAPRIIKVDPEARSSMWDDLQRGRRTEIDMLNGEIVDAAARANTRAPVNESIVALVKAAEGKSSPCLSSSDLRARVPLSSM